MNASYAWLRAMVPTGLTPRALAELLTSRTATVDGLRPLRADLEPIVIARVVECARHPGSDHLSVTRVDAGGELVDVVCGAPNVRAGAVYPFAPVGTVMPNGLRIEKRKIRGAVSEGMLCSARELGLGEDHEGILELDLDVPTGTPLLQALPLGDTILDVDITPNRPDLLSHLGLAREIAAAEGAPVTLPVFAGDDGGTGPQMTRAPREAHAGGVRVALEDAEGCPRALTGLPTAFVLSAAGLSTTWSMQRTICSTSWASQCTLSMPPLSADRRSSSGVLALEKA
jgi:phenylalanyl-tRNA synthetase beta chain